MADERTDLDLRPSPEALLAEARREEKARAGRLKIFVGAAPGVGKTYEMLETARARLKEGVMTSSPSVLVTFSIPITGRPVICLITSTSCLPLVRMPAAPPF